MRRRDAGRRPRRSGARLAAALSAGVLAAGILAACGPAAGPTDPEEVPVDYGNVIDAVTAATPRVVAAEDPEQSQNGLGKRLALTLRADSVEPFRADELDAVAEAIWRTLPWEPNSIDLVVGAETTDGLEPVDLRTAAAELEPMGFTEAGRGGVSLFDMPARYGAWEAPE